MMTDRDQAIFEAGIKLGALYHQWVGTPISRKSAAGVESAIEQAVILQPYVEVITVRLDRNLMTENTFGYSELSGLMFNVGNRHTRRVYLLQGTTCSSGWLSPHADCGVLCNHRTFPSLMIISTLTR